MSDSEGYLEKAKGRLEAAELLLKEGFPEDAVSRAWIFHKRVRRMVEKED